MDSLDVLMFKWTHRPHVLCHKCNARWNTDDCRIVAINAVRDGYDPGDMMCPNCEAEEKDLEIYFDYD